MATQVASSRRAASPVRHGTCRWVAGWRSSLDALLNGSGAVLSITSVTGRGPVTNEYMVTPKLDSKGLAGWSMIRTDTLADEAAELIGYDMDAELTTCSCPDHQYRGCQCKHLRALRAALKSLGIGN